jgi:hypothetical protein
MDRQTYYKSHDFSIEGRLYTFIIGYGQSLFAGESDSVLESLMGASCCILRWADAAGSQKGAVGLAGSALSPLTSETEEPDEALERVVFAAMRQAGFSYEQQKYVDHWLLGESVPIKDESP